MDINEKLNNLTEKSVWYFAKQETLNSATL